MSEIKNYGSKGYLFLGVAIFLLLFTMLVVYLYQYNMFDVPQDPERFSLLIKVMDFTSLV